MILTLMVDATPAFCRAGTETCRAAVLVSNGLRSPSGHNGAGGPARTLSSFYQRD